jgi:TolA-binding protein
MVLRMGVPNAPATVTPQQLADLNKKLSHMRHEVNNQLALSVAALELIRFRPELRDKMLDTIAQQSPKITAEIAQFSAAFEEMFGITRD